MSPGPSTSTIAATRTETRTSLPILLPVPHLAMLRLRLRPSRQLAWLIGAGHTAAGSVCWVAPIPWWLSLGLSLGVAVSLGFSVHRIVRGWNGLELKPDGTVAVEDWRGRWAEARILGSSFVSPRLTILNLTLAGTWLPRSLVVAPDALAADEFRRLRVWLRWRAALAERTRTDNQADT